MTAETLPATTHPDERRNLALLKAVGLDRLAPEQRELALNIAQRYELDLLLKHLVMIEGRPYITRDGLLHIAHRSGQLDGIETTEPVVIDDFWRVTCSVFRKDMSHPFRYVGRYPTKGGNQKFAPEMATKVAEVMSLRRAFDVAAPTAEERWDLEQPEATTPPPPPPTLRDRVAEKVGTPIRDVVNQQVDQKADLTPLSEDPDEAAWTEAIEAAAGVEMTGQEFLRRTKAANVDGVAIRTAAHKLFGEQKSGDLTNAQWGRLAAEVGVA